MFQRADIYVVTNHSSCKDMDATTSDATFTENSQPNKCEEDVEIDNSRQVAKNISSLYFNRLMTDVSLSVGGESYAAHRLILSASSDVFQVMLMSPRWEESRQSNVSLQESPQCTKVFEKFLRYLYTGQINFNHNSALPILMLADKYIVKDLNVLCLGYMSSHVAYAAFHGQLFNWLHYSLTMGHQKVAQVCLNFVKWNFVLASSLPDFITCEVSILEQIVQQGDLIVTDETDVYKGVVHWLEGQEVILQHNSGVDVKEEMLILVERLVKHIRFPMMTPRQLAELLLSPILILYKEFLIKHMAVAMAYHSDDKDLIEHVCQRDGVLGHLQFTPRLYTAEQFRCELNIDNYNSSQSFLSHTLMFSSQTTLAEHAGEQTCDWVIDLYPKGVWFHKCFLIEVQGTVEVPESIQEIVRVTITCKDSPKEGIKVKVGLLTLGEQAGVEHIMAITQSVHRFTEGDNVLKLDKILSFHDLNSNEETKNPSPFLTGPNKDTLKLVFVIVPLSDESISDIKTVPISKFIKLMS